MEAGSRRPQDDAAAAFTLMQGDGSGLSALVRRLWPQLSKAAVTAMMEVLPSLLEYHKPSWMQELAIASVDLGEVPPTISNPVVLTNADDELDKLTVTADVIWPSRCSVTLRVVPLSEERLASFLPRFACEALRSWSTVKATVKDVCVEASLVVALCPLTDRMPIARGLSISLRETPKTRMDIFVFDGEARMGEAVKDYILDAVSTLVWPMLTLPERVCVRFDATCPDVTKPEGMLVCRVVGVSNLPAGDVDGGCDPYCIAHVRSSMGSSFGRTATGRGCSTELEEGDFRFLVHSRALQTLSLRVHDSDLARPDERVGIALVPLSTLVPGHRYSEHLPLHTITGREPREKGEVVAGASLHVEYAYYCSTCACVREQLRAAPPDSVAPPDAALADVLAGGILQCVVVSVVVPHVAALPLLARASVGAAPRRDSESFGFDAGCAFGDALASAAATGGGGSGSGAGSGGSGAGAGAGGSLGGCGGAAAVRSSAGGAAAADGGGDAGVGAVDEAGGGQPPVQSPRQQHMERRRLLDLPARYPRVEGTTKTGYLVYPWPRDNRHVTLYQKLEFEVVKAHQALRPETVISLELARSASAPAVARYGTTFGEVCAHCVAPGLYGFQAEVPVGGYTLVVAVWWQPVVPLPPGGGGDAS